MPCCGRAMFAATAVVLNLSVPLSAAPQASKPQAPIPSSWGEFGSSTNPEDKQLFAAIQKQEWWNVCRDWGRALRASNNKQTRRVAAHRAYLDGFKFINGLDIGHVREGRVEVGMTTCGVFAALGTPDAINRTKTATNQTAQLVYRNRDVYVYTEGKPDDWNAIVRAVQY